MCTWTWCATTWRRSFSTQTCWRTSSCIQTRRRRRRSRSKILYRLRKHGNDPRFVALGERLEQLRDRHLQGQLTSIEFLKSLLELARDVVEAEREIVPAEEIDRGKAALTELFESVKNDETPIVVEQVVDDIDDIVRVVRFDGWQQTTAGEREVQRALRRAPGPGAL